ncbi:MAG: type III pantothenate kinase [Candidatus Omnitrophica bacterium]|nr:type III pantothenate kinase [Candidatus Omnitrophota bacterium]
MDMLLAIDIGNTNINFGLFRGKRLVKSFFIGSGVYNQRKLKSALARNGITKCEIIVCSVVPRLTAKLKKDIKKIFNRLPIIVGKDLMVPLNNLYRHPKKVGCDRLVNAFAAVERYGTPLVVVDFGTAVTFDVISKKKEYCGGMILPGLKMSLEALKRKTALLPHILLSRPPEFIGRDTRSSILSGIVYGFAALSDSLIEKIKEKIGQEAFAIGTGGDIGLIGSYCRKLNFIEKHLTVQGLNGLYRRCKEGKGNS